MANLNDLKRKSTRPAPRVGRGGKRGKTAGRGTKGQNARSGRKKRPELRDIIKKLPKRRGYGKNRGRTVNPARIQSVSVTLASIERAFDAGASVDPKALAEKGLVPSRGAKRPVKIIGASVSSRITVSGCAVSAGARSAIEKAGGSVGEK